MKGDKVIRKMSYNLPISSHLQLIRFSRFSDNSSQFLFLIPSGVLRGFISEIDSSTFEYANYVWRLKAVRSKVHIGVFLEFIIPTTASGRRSSEKISIRLDLSITVINLEHFSDNQNFKEHQVPFNNCNTVRGSGCLIEASTVKERNFVRDDDQLLIELELSNVIINLTLPLAPRSEDHFESTDFHFGGETWKLSLTNDWEDQTILKIVNQSPRQNLLYRISFELSVSSEQVKGRRIDLLVHNRDARIQVSEEANRDILGRSKYQPKQKMLFVFLRDVRLYKFSTMSVPPGVSKCQSFFKSTEDDQGNLWNVMLSVSSRNLFVKLLPGGMNYITLEPNTTRIVGWSWRLLNNLHENGIRSTNHIFFCHQNLLSLEGLKSTPIAKAETANKLCSDAGVYQKKFKDLKGEECLNFTSPSEFALKVPKTSLDGTEPLEFLLCWHFNRLLRFENFNRIDEVTYRQMHQMRNELKLLRQESTSLRLKLKAT